MGGQGGGKGVSYIFREYGRWQGGYGDSNEEDPSLSEHSRVRKECPQRKQGPRREGELVSGLKVAGHL